MKKLVALVLLIGLAISLFACSDNKKPITLQDFYDAGESHVALLGDHESVYLVYTYNGKVIQEEYYDKKSFYSFYDDEHFGWGSNFSTFISENAEYYYSENTYSFNITLTLNGMADMKEYFAIVGTTTFVSQEMADDKNAVITKEDGVVIATVTAGEEELAAMGEEIASCVETYTLDAKTREMISVKTVYTYKDGRVDEGIITITRDAAAPEGMKPYVAFENETENLRTITVVTNPGAENEKTESIQIAKGLTVSASADILSSEQTLEIYADAACTQLFEGDQDPNADLTIYAKWGV